MKSFETCFENKRALIAGGFGFIGSNLARRLVALGARVSLVDALVPEHGGNPFNVRDLKERVSTYPLDVRETRHLAPLLKNQDYLFNLVGQTSHLDSMKDPEADLEFNARSQLTLLETCRKCNPEIQIVFASTRQIYGVPDYLPVDEKHPLHPVDINGIHKIAGESYYLLYHRVYGLKTSILRPTNTYGPRMRIRDARQTFLGLWIRQLLAGEEILVFGKGTQVRDFTYVEDAVEAFLLAAASREAEGQVFNLGSDERIRLEDLAKLLIQIHGSGSYRFVPFPPELKAIDIGDYYADDTRIRMQLGWRPRVRLEEGLRRTLTYYRENSPHYL